MPKDRLKLIIVLPISTYQCSPVVFKILLRANWIIDSNLQSSSCRIFGTLLQSNTFTKQFVHSKQ